MQEAPDIDVIISLDVEGQIGKAPHRPATDPRQLEFESITRRSTFRVTCYVPESLFDGIDEAQCNQFTRFLEIMIDAFQDVPLGPASQDDRPGTHFSV